MHYSYPVDLSRDADGRWLARLDGIPGAVTDGASRAEAMDNAADALEEAIAGHLARRDPVPPPPAAKGRPLISPGTVIAAKAAMHQLMAETNTTNSALARVLGCQEGEVRRLLNPRHASKMGRLEDALAALGCRVHLRIARKAA